MIIPELLTYFRKKRGLKQVEAMPKNMSQPSYSSVERGERPLNLEELEDYLNNTSISPTEFFSYSEFGTDQNTFKKVFHSYANIMDSEPESELKQVLLDYFYTYKKTMKTNRRHLANYIVIKHFYHQYLKEIGAFTQEEVDLVFDILSQQKDFFYYDYQALTNIIVHLHPAKAEYLLKLMIPIKNIESRDAATLTQAYSAINNIVSVSIYAKMYTRARRYLDLAKKNNESLTDYKLKLNLFYLDNLLSYLQTGKNKYLNNVEQYREIIKVVGTKPYLQQLDEEIDLLTFQKRPEKLLNKFKISLYDPTEKE